MLPGAPGRELFLQLHSPYFLCSFSFSSPNPVFPTPISKLPRELSFSFAVLWPVIAQSSNTGVLPSLSSSFSFRCLPLPRIPFLSTLPWSHSLFFLVSPAISSYPSSVPRALTSSFSHPMKSRLFPQTVSTAISAFYNAFPSQSASLAS